MATVVIDPGHGGTEVVGGSSPNNATAPNGLLEKNVLLDIAVCICRSFSRDHRVILTRDSDDNLSLGDRANVAREAEALIFVSLHFNGFNGSVQGTETFVHPQRSESSTRLASCLQNTVLQATALSDRKVKLMNLGVLRPANHLPVTAAVLVEFSFMDVPAEANRLNSADYRTCLARSVMDGVDLYLSGPDVWGDVRYAPQALGLWKRASRFVRDMFAADGLEH